MKENIVAKRAYTFALKVVFLHQLMVENKEYVISKQILKSATSIGANIEEASAACSRREFVFKMAIASKEARESRYWLKLLAESNIIEDYDFSELLKEINELMALLTKIVKTINTEQN
jgi:four helix bundle protein